MEQHATIPNSAGVRQKLVLCSVAAMDLPAAAPGLQRKTSAEKARDAKPIFDSSDSKEEKVSILIRCSGSRLTVELSTKMSVTEATHFVADRVKPSGSPFQMRIQKGGKKICVSHDGVNPEKSPVGGKSLQELGITKKAQFRVSAKDGKTSLEISGSKAPPSTRSAPTRAPGSGGSILRPTSLKELQDIISGAGTKAVVVDFFATWCGPCRSIAPAFADLAKKHTNTVLFVKVDADKLKDAVAAMGVSAFPTFQMFFGGYKVDELRGADEQGLRARVAAISRLGSQRGRRSGQSPPMPTPSSTASSSGSGGRPFGGRMAADFAGMLERRAGGTSHGGSPSSMGSGGGGSSSSSGGGGRVHTFGNIHGGGGRAAARAAASGSKKIFSATDLGFGGRGG